MKANRREFLGSASAAAVLSATGTAFGQKKYDDGASDTEIKIGNSNPCSGPASSYGAIGKTIDAYWKSVNEAGGINGRKVTFISLDDGYSPPRRSRSCASWSSRRRCWRCSRRSARRPIRRSTNT